MSARGSFRSRPMMAAVVLGTALTALGAEAQASEIPTQAVGDIGRYCASCWRNARLPVDAWGDCTQEVFRRLLERVPTKQWDMALKADGDERREFLRAIDAVKKRTQRAKRYSSEIDSAADDRFDHQRQLAEEREAVRLAASEVLSLRQQHIMQLSFEGYSVQQISEEMALPTDRVSDEKYKAIRKLRGHLCSAET